MAKDNNVDISKLKKFYKELVKLNKDVTLDLFKKKSVLCSEYIENLKQPKGYIVIGDKIYYDEKEIGTFKVKQFYSSNSSDDVNIDDLNIVPKRSFLSKTKDKILGIVNKPAEEELQEKIKDIYYENFDLIKELLKPYNIKCLTQEEIDSLRRFEKKYDDNKDIFPSLFVSNRKAKQFLDELEYEKNEYLERFDKNSEIKYRLDDYIDTLEQMQLDFDKFEDQDKNKFRTILKDTRDLERDISDKYILDHEKLFNKLDNFESFLEEMDNKYYTVTSVTDSEPLSGPIEQDPVVEVATTVDEEEEKESSVAPTKEPDKEAKVKPKIVSGTDLKEYIAKEKAVREKTNEFDEALDEAHKKYDEEMKKLQDRLYDEAVETVVNDQKVSIGYLQRKLRIGFNRASDLIDLLEVNGIIGPADEYGKRDVLVTKDEKDLNDGDLLDLDNINIVSAKAKSVPKTVVSEEESLNDKKEDIEEEKNRKTEELKNKFKETRTKKMEEQQKIEEEKEEPKIDIDLDLDSLDKRIYDTYSVSDINEIKSEISNIDSKINETSNKIDKKEKQILETEVALDLASQNSNIEKTQEYSEKLEKRRKKLEKLKEEQQELETKKEEKESVINRFKDESIRVYEQGEKAKQEEYEKEEKTMEERLEKEALEERDKNRKEIADVFKKATDDDLSALTHKSKKEIQQYVSSIEKLESEGKDVEKIKKEYDELLKAERKAIENRKKLEEEMGISDKGKKTSKKK